MEGKGSNLPNREKLELPEQSKLESKFLVTEEKRSKAKPKITAPPRSDLLDRLDKFLPALQQANAQLGSSDDAKLELTETDEGGNPSNAPPNQPYIELDLACGVFDLQNEAAVEAAEKSIARGWHDDASHSDSSDEDDDQEEEDCDTSDDDIDIGSNEKESGDDKEGRTHSRKKKESRSRKKHPGIEVI